MKKTFLVTIVIIIAIIGFSYYVISKNNHDIDEQLVKCIASKSTLYIQTGCFACQKQEELFGENYKYINVVNCAIDGMTCYNEKITATPTWVINEQKYKGYKTIEELKELTGCELKEVENQNGE